METENKISRETALGIFDEAMKIGQSLNRLMEILEGEDNQVDAKSYLEFVRQIMGQNTDIVLLLRKQYPNLNPWLESLSS
jgi:hypothetical protein